MRCLTLLLPICFATALSVSLVHRADADILELRDGRLVEGVVLKDGATYRVTDRFGVVDIAVKDVKSWTKGASVDDMIKAHLAKISKDDTKNRVLLGQWLKKLGRDEEAEAVAMAVLVLEPENQTAHAILGHLRHRGHWITPDEAKRAEGYEKHGEQWYTPKEWHNLETADAKKAAALEEVARKKKINADVNKYVRLMMSPDTAVRARGKKLLEDLAAELDSNELRKLVKRVEAHVQKVAEVRKRVAAAAALGSKGHVVSEIRATMSKLKRPIDVFETSLASNIGGAPVRIQLPELEVIKIRTTGVIPAYVDDGK